MRALFVMDRLSARGGAERYLRDLVRALPGVSWHAAYGHADGTTASVRSLFASATRIPGLDGRGPDAAACATGLDRLEAAVASVRPDRVLVQNVMSPRFLDALGRMAGAVIVVQDHRMFCPARGKVFPDGTPCSEPMGPACDRCFLQDDRLDAELRDQRFALVRARQQALFAFGRIVVLSAYMRRELGAIGVRGDRLSVIAPAAPDWQPLVPLGDRVAVLGRISWHKGSLHLLRALADACVHAPVVFVGSGPDQDRARDEARELRLDLRVTGWKDHAEVATELASSRLVAMPSLWAEPFGISGIDAAVLGLPVVAHAVGAIPEWLQHEQTGLLAAPGDAAAFAQAVARLVLDLPLARRLGLAAREHVLAQFSLARFAASWGAELSRLASSAAS